MLRTSTRQDIATILDEGYFGGANFSLAFGGAEHEYFSVRFIPNPNYSLHCLKRDSRVLPFELVRSPGPNILQDERTDVDTIDRVLKEISPWVERIREEVVTANPLAREVQRFRDEVESKLNALGEEMETFFTRDEATVLNEKLSVLASRVDSLVSENEKVKETVQRMTTAIEHLQKSLEEVNKGTWFRMAAGKLTAIAKSVFTSKEAREFALEAAKKLLLEGPPT